MSQKFNIILITTIFFFVNSSAQALPTETIPSVQEVTKKVLQAANNYAGTVSCVEFPAQAEDIAALNPYTMDEDKYEAQYLVFWYGDIGCAGGSGTSGFNAATVKIRAGDTFIVDPLRSSPTIDFEFNTRFLEQMVGNTKDTLVVDAGEFAANDSNCCPTLRFRYTLRVDDKGNWKQIKKKPLPSKKSME